MKKFFKKWLPVILAATLLFGAVAGVVKLVSIKTRSVSATNFKVGALDENTGEAIENEKTIYTKNAIECIGLSITPDFDNQSEYQIFWYNLDEKYIGHTNRFARLDKFTSGNVPELARYCRIVVYPSDAGENGVKQSDFKVKFYEPITYARLLSIKVNKKQEYSDYEMVSLARSFPYRGKTATSAYDMVGANPDEMFAENFSASYYLSSGKPAGMKLSITPDPNRDVMVFVHDSAVLSYAVKYSNAVAGHAIRVGYYDNNNAPLTTNHYHQYGDLRGGDSLILTPPTGTHYIVIEFLRTAENEFKEQTNLEYSLYKYYPKNEYTEFLYNK